MSILHAPAPVDARELHPSSVRAVRSLLEALGYQGVTITEVVAYVQENATATDCPTSILDVEDRDTLNALLVDLGEYGPSHPSEWPGWTDLDRYEPCPDDQSWHTAASRALPDWAAELDADAEFQRRAAEFDREDADGSWLDRLRAGHLAEQARTNARLGIISREAAEAIFAH